MLELGSGISGKGLAGLVHLTQEQVQVGQHGLPFGATAGLEPLLGGGDAVRFALGKARGGEGAGGQSFGRLGTFRPAAEQIHLFLHRQEGPDLLQKGGEFSGRQVGIARAFEPPTPLHQLLQQGQTLCPLRCGREVAAEQIQNPKGH